MNEKQFTEICNLHKAIEEQTEKEKEIYTTLKLPDVELLNAVVQGIRQIQGEQDGSSLLLNRTTDKLFFDNRERILDVVYDILGEELNKVKVKKNDLKLKFKEVEVKINDNSKTDK